MNCFLPVRSFGVASIVGTLFACLCTANAEMNSGQALVQSVYGAATCSTDEAAAFALTPGAIVGRGASLKTDANSTADVILKASGTTLRLTPNTLVEIVKLDREVAGEDVVTTTRLNLKSGSILGVQHKLHNPSKFEITTSGGVATINGTEFLVQADGTMTCFKGELSANYLSPAKSDASSLEVPAGFSSSPGAKDLTAIGPSLLTLLNPDVQAVHQNAAALKTESVAVISKLSQKVSPTKGNNGVGNGQDPQPPGNPPVNDGPGTGPGSPGNKGGAKK
jgi:hypothetical protein